MNRSMFSVRSVQIACGALVVALLLAAWTAARAIRVDETTTAPPPSFATSDALARAPSIVPVDISEVVAMNLFSPDRKAPARRYSLSGYAPVTDAAPPARPLVLGTAVASGNRSFAVARMPDGAPTIVRVGDKLGIYTVRSIERNQVVFYVPGQEPFAVTASRQ